MQIKYAKKEDIFYELELLSSILHSALGSLLMSGYRRRCHYIVRHGSHPTL